MYFVRIINLFVIFKCYNVKKIELLKKKIKIVHPYKDFFGFQAVQSKPTYKAQGKATIIVKY